MLLLERVEQLQPVEPAALQPDVEKHQIGPPRHHGRQRVVAVARRARAVTFVLEDARDQLADISLVVDDEDIGCHLRRPCPALYHTTACCGSTGAAAATDSAATRNCIQAPRAPAIFSAASCNSMRPPCSSRMRPTMARPSPVPFSRVVTRSEE